MPQYKYKKIITKGPFGTTIRHRSTDENKIITLGDMNEYTYIFAENLGEQNKDLVFEETILTKEELDYLRRNDVYITGIEASIQAGIKNIVKDYPQFEIDTFATQESEAKVYMSDNETLTPFIDNLCLSRGIEKDVMVAKILANAEALKLATSSIIGQYQKIVSTK